MTSFESAFRFLQAKLDDLHPDEPIPPIYISELISDLATLGGHVDQLEREKDLAKNRLF